MTEPQAKTPTPWWKKTWVIALASLVVGIGIGSASGSDADTPSPQPAPTVTETITAEPEAEPAPTETVTVYADPEATVNADGTIDEPEPEVDEDDGDDKTTGGLDAYEATAACGNLAETGLKNTFPSSKVKVHTIMGILAQTYRADTDDWFIKVQASVDSNTVDVECIVSGVEFGAVVDDILWY